jgi:tetratricopeptide (TPR) repeat protein
MCPCGNLEKLCGHFGKTCDMFKKAVGSIESPLEYFKKSLALNPSGLASAGLMNRAAREWASQKRIDDAMALLKVAVELHPKSGSFYDACWAIFTSKKDRKNWRGRLMKSRSRPTRILSMPK